MNSAKQFLIKCKIKGNSTLYFKVSKGKRSKNELHKPNNDFLSMTLKGERKCAWISSCAGIKESAYQPWERWLDLELHQFRTGTFCRANFSIILPRRALHVLLNVFIGSLLYKWTCTEFIQLSNGNCKFNYNNYLPISVISFCLICLQNLSSGRFCAYCL